MCSVEGCDRPVQARGWCELHYRRWRKRGDPGQAGMERRRLYLGFDLDESQEECIVVGCDRKRHGRRLCSLCYKRFLYHGVPLPPSEYPDICTVEGCEKPHKGRGFCEKHLRQAYRDGTIERPECGVTGCDRPSITGGFCEKHYAGIRQARKRRGACKVDGCDKPAGGSQGYCTMHYTRFLKTGDVGPAGSLIGLGHIDSNGYMKLGQRLVHRLVMEETLGRPLRKGENVHHINGDRLDNRPENLELWSKAQPPGQRIPDKVAWAIELLSLYEPSALASPVAPEQLVLL